jgi:hypothetical protein
LVLVVWGAGMITIEQAFYFTVGFSFVALAVMSTVLLLD